MRIGNIIRIVGISAALVAPVAFVGCDDDDGSDPTPDTGVGTGGVSGDALPGTGGSAPADLGAGGAGGTTATPDGGSNDSGAGGTGGAKADAGGDATVG